MYDIKVIFSLSLPFPWQCLQYGHFAKHCPRRSAPNVYFKPQDGQKEVSPGLEQENEIRDREVSINFYSFYLAQMKQLNPFLKFRMFYPSQNTQKVKHRTYIIDYTKTAVIGKTTYRVLILS